MTIPLLAIFWHLVEPGCPPTLIGKVRSTEVRNALLLRRESCLEFLRSNERSASDISFSPWQPPCNFHHVSAFFSLSLLSTSFWETPNLRGRRQRSPNPSSPHHCLIPNDTSRKGHIQLAVGRHHFLPTHYCSSSTTRRNFQEFSNYSQSLGRGEASSHGF